MSSPPTPDPARHPSHAPSAIPSDHQYIAAARELHGCAFICINDDASIERTDDGLGAYITAQVWVEREEALRPAVLPPEPGPTKVDSLLVPATAGDD
jgi:hypothetical protein